MSSADPQSKTPRKRRWVIWIAALLILLGGGSYLLSQRSANPAPAKGANPRGRNARGGGGAIPVSIEKVRQGNMGVYISALGTVTPVYTATITSRVAGPLLEGPHREGPLVHKRRLVPVV